MPPQIGKADYSGDVREEGGGGFFSQKIGPLPIWVLIAAGIVVLYALFVKFGSTNSRNPLVQTAPTDIAPYSNLENALQQILNNQNGGGSGSGSGSGSGTSGSRGTNQSPPSGSTSSGSAPVLPPTGLGRPGINTDTATTGQGNPASTPRPRFATIYQPGMGGYVGPLGFTNTTPSGPAIAYQPKRINLGRLR